MDIVPGNPVVPIIGMPLNQTGLGPPPLDGSKEVGEMIFPTMAVRLSLSSARNLGILHNGPQQATLGEPQSFRGTALFVGNF